MKIGDTVEWVNGVGITMTGKVIETPLTGDRPKVLETRHGTILRPMNAKVIKSAEKVEIDINTLKELTLTIDQAVWLLNRNFVDDSQWTLPDDGSGAYQESLEFKITVNSFGIKGSVKINTWV